jgi:thiol-disulfide isomerase/thioredoxin
LRATGFLCALLVTLSTTSIGATSANLPQALPQWPLLDTLQGKVVLVDFWASWCGPCLQSFPWMNDMHARHADDGLVIVAVNVDNDRELADGFLKKLPPQFRVEYDPQGMLAQAFGVLAMPTSFLIGRDGTVRARHAGFRDKQRAGREQEIEQLLKERAP